MSLWLILAILYALFHSGVSALDRYVLNDNKKGEKIDSLTFSMFRFVINAAIAMFLSLAFLIDTIPYDLNFWIYILAIASVYAISATSYFFAIKYEEVSKMIPLGQSITTVLAYLLSLMLLMESTSLFDVFGTIGIVVGSYLILTDGKIFNGKLKPKKTKTRLSKELSLIIIWSVTLSIFGVLSKSATSFIQPVVLNVFLYLFVALYFFLLNSLINRKNMLNTTKAILSNKKTLLFTIASSLLATSGTLLLLIALSIGNASEVLPVSKGTPLFVVLFGGLILKEKNWKIRLLGACLIVLGIYGIYI